MGRKKSKKIGILTWHYLDNYGSVLQAYSLMKVLERKGLKVEFINYRRDAKTGSIYDFLRAVKYNFATANTDEKRKSTFYHFRKKHLKETKMFGNRAELEQYPFDYDYLVCGSDQIWSSLNLDPVYLLGFYSGSAVKFSYAASTIRDEYTEQQKSVITRNLKEFQGGISVREEKGVEIIRKLTDKEVVSVLDPTLMLVAEDYQELAAKSSCDYTDYIVCYFIGDVDRYEEITNRIKQKYGASKVININIRDIHNFGDVILRTASPYDFLKLIRDAKAVVSDSYHAICFSIIFQKEFFAVKRFLDTDYNNQNERLTNILNMIGEQRRYVSSDECDLEVSPLDYERINALISERQDMSNSYIDHALQGGEYDND